METLQKWVNSIAVCCEKHHLQGGKAKLTYDAEAQLCLLQMSQLFLLTQLSFVVCVDVRVHDTEAWTDTYSANLPDYTLWGESKTETISLPHPPGCSFSCLNGNVRAR